MDNTEGTPEPRDSVETIRGASVSKEQLQHDYEAAGSLRKLADIYGIERHKLRDILTEASIPIKSRRQAITNSWTREERQRVQREKITASWQDDEIRKSRTAHWDLPGERERQREARLRYLRIARFDSRKIPPAEAELHMALIKASVSFTTSAIVVSGKYIVDVLIHQNLLVIEADGSSHSFDSSSDADREEVIKNSGLKIARFTYQQLHDDSDNCVSTLNLQPEDTPAWIIRTHAAAFSIIIGVRNGKYMADDDIVRSAAGW